MLLGLVLCMLVAAQAHYGSREAQLVHTTQGPVRGYKEDDLFIFYGIPYATGPTGVNKFKEPLPSPVWIQPFEAIEKNIICLQANITNITNDKKHQEDCLIANVYVPDTKRINLPVVVYVHGGGYQMGFGQLFTPKHLVRTKKIIAVTFNYRVGIHGFLCLGTSEVPGNAGMKDQVALLRWVNKNIASFGGNPDDVTITGYSSGSSAVDLLQLSKTTEGLFHKVIPESGANVGVWSVQQDPIEKAKEFARKHNFTDVDDIYALEKFYMTLPFGILTLTEFMERTDSTFGFAPCVESDIGVERFLDDSPVNILKAGKYKKLPMLYGFSKMEGLLRAQSSEFHAWVDGMNKNFSDFLPADLIFESEKQREEIAKEIKEFYFGDAAVNDENVINFINYFSDVMFSYAILRSVKLQVEAGNHKIYLYEYSYTGDDHRSTIANLNVRGAYHCAQSASVLDGDGIFHPDEINLSEDNKKMKTVTRKLWLNFMTTGSPVPEGSSFPAWPSVGADRGPHMSLDRTLQLRGPLLAARAHFWDGIYERHYRQPVPPPQHPPRPHGEL